MNISESVPRMNRSRPVMRLAARTTPSAQLSTKRKSRILAPMPQLIAS